jgi:hypothetical protein
MGIQTISGGGMLLTQTMVRGKVRDGDTSWHF